MKAKRDALPLSGRTRTFSSSKSVSRLSLSVTAGASSSSAAAALAAGGVAFGVAGATAAVAAGAGAVAALPVVVLGVVGMFSKSSSNVCMFAILVVLLSCWYRFILPKLTERHELDLALSACHLRLPSERYLAINTGFVTDCEFSERIEFERELVLVKVVQKGLFKSRDHFVNNVLRFLFS